MAARRAQAELTTVQPSEAYAQAEGSELSLPLTTYHLLSLLTTDSNYLLLKAGDSELDARVVLIGHSAGGWLARALLAVAGDAWVSEHGQKRPASLRGHPPLHRPETSKNVLTYERTGQ